MTTYYQAEDRRYSDLYRKGYGVGPIVSLLKWSQSVGVPLDNKSVIDCGCGRSSLLRHVRTMRQYVGIDIARFPLGTSASTHGNSQTCHFVHGSLDRLPFATAAFDISWCCDVLEHIPESLVPQCIQEIVRVCRTAVYSISTRPSHCLDSAGNNLHLTVRPAEWWHDQVSHAASITSQVVRRFNISMIACQR